MHYKRYEAKSMKEALSQVREELGPNALILSSRALKRGKEGALEGNGRWVEVTAAMEPALAQAPAGRPEGKNRKMADQRPPAATQQRPLVQALPDSAASQRLHNLGLHGVDLCLILSQLGFGSLLLNLFKKMEFQGIETHISLSLLEKVRMAMARSGKDGTPSMVLRLFRKILKDKVATLALDPVWDNGPAVMCMVGPTGVGKTTTVAKLAARFAIEQGKRVVLATLDTYRIAAVEQLKIYANVMGLPLQVIHNAEDIARLHEDHQETDVILLDTAGRSPNNDRHLNDLKDSLAGNPRLQNYLLLSAGVQEADTVRIVERFSEINLQGLIFTKLDECSRFGGMFNLAYRARLPLAYFTTGQKVPDDLESADVDRMLKYLFAFSG